MMSAYAPGLICTWPCTHSACRPAWGQACVAQRCVGGRQEAAVFERLPEDAACTCCHALHCHIATNFCIPSNPTFHCTLCGSGAWQGPPACTGRPPVDVRAGPWGSFLEPPFKHPRGCPLSKPEFLTLVHTPALITAQCHMSAAALLPCHPAAHSRKHECPFLPSFFPTNFHPKKLKFD